MSRAPRISRSVLSDQVKEHLLQAILAGSFAPGDRIVETRVARDLGISQAPVREALRDLEALGIVDIAPFRGARVRRPDKLELLEGIGVRAQLEVLAASQAVARITDLEIEALEADFVALRRAAIRRDRVRAAILDVGFHRRIVEIAGNRTLERVWRFLEPTARTSITLAMPGVDPVRIADLHKPILEALRARDPSGTEEGVRAHFEVVGATFDRLFAPPEPVGVGVRSRRAHTAATAGAA